MKDKESILTVAAEVREELHQLETLSADIHAVWRRFNAGEAEVRPYLLDSAALKVHHFYTGCERIFETIATEINGAVPRTPDWHVRLLRSMAIEVPGVRPPVLTPGLARDLEEYLKFRHLVRNVYAFQLDPEKLKPLVEKLGGVFAKLQKETGGFLLYLEKLASEI